MENRTSTIRRAGFAARALAAATALAVAGAAGAAEYVSPATLSFIDFSPVSPATSYCVFHGYGGDTGHVGSDFGTCCLAAPVHLPDAVTLGTVVFYIYDNSGNNLTLSLRRKRIGTSTAGSSVMASVATSGASTSTRLFSSSTIADAVIDNGLYTYYAVTDTCIPNDNNLRIYSAILFYTE